MTRSEKVEIIWAVTEAGTFFTSYRGDPTWDTREMRERVFDRVNELLEEKRLRELEEKRLSELAASAKGRLIGLDVDDWYASEFERMKDRSPGGDMSVDMWHLQCGLYRLHWKSGGSSLASVGYDSQGIPWMAPINWVSPGNTWHLVERAERLEPDLDADVARLEKENEDLRRQLEQCHADNWYAVELERTKDRTPA